jgi:hypothetical protein
MAVSSLQPPPALLTAVRRVGTDVHGAARALLRGGDLADFHEAMADQIALLHSSAAVAANANDIELDPEAQAILDGELGQQLAYLDRFVHQIASGEQDLDDSLLSRAAMYVQAARKTFTEIARGKQADAGYQWERRVLEEGADHCDECIEAAEMGWQPIGTLPPLGDATCLTNCKCSFEYATAAPEEAPAAPEEEEEEVEFGGPGSGRYPKGSHLSRDEVIAHIEQTNPPEHVRAGKMDMKEWSDRFLSNEPDGYVATDVHPKSLNMPVNPGIESNVEAYSQRPAVEAPAIVVDSNDKLQARYGGGKLERAYGLQSHTVIDGKHRLAAALRRGDTSIHAIVPVRKLPEIFNRSHQAELIEFAHQYAAQKGIKVTSVGEGAYGTINVRVQRPDGRTGEWSSRDIERIGEKSGHLFQYQSPGDAGFGGPGSGRYPKGSHLEKSREDFHDLADLQRDRPEHAMLKVQRVMGGGIINGLVEHVGDLIHRMSEKPTFSSAGYEFVKDKVDKTLDWLTNPYGARREFEGNIEGAANYFKRPVEDFRHELYAAMDKYAAEHRALPAFNRAQKIAQAAAVAIGERRFGDAIKYLKILKAHLGSRDQWKQFAHHGLKEDTASFGGPGSGRYPKGSGWKRPKIGRPSQTIYDKWSLKDLIDRRTQLERDMNQLAQTGWEPIPGYAGRGTKEYPGLTAQIARSNYKTLALQHAQVESAFYYVRDKSSRGDAAFGGPGSGRYPKGSGQPRERLGERKTQMVKLAGKKEREPGREFSEERAGHGPNEPVNPASASFKRIMGLAEGAPRMSDISERQIAYYTKVVNECLSDMSQGAVDRLSESLSGMRFYGDLNRITADFISRGRSVPLGSYIAGFYGPATSTIYLDGGKNARGQVVTTDIKGTYIHEMTHAIDGPKFEISNSLEWQNAWQNEIKSKGTISAYASDSPLEGFAEFGRASASSSPLLFLTSRETRERYFEKNFPECTAVWKKWRIW